MVLDDFDVYELFDDDHRPSSFSPFSLSQAGDEPNFYFKSSDFSLVSAGFDLF